jgi:hypothetical protein
MSHGNSLRTEVTRSARRSPRPAVPRRQSDDARQAHGRIDRLESSPHALPGAAPTVPHRARSSHRQVWRKPFRCLVPAGHGAGSPGRLPPGHFPQAMVQVPTLLPLEERRPVLSLRAGPPQFEWGQGTSSDQPGEPDSGAVGVAGHVGSCCCPSEERRSRTAPSNGRFRPETDLLAKGWPGCQVWFVPTDRTPASGIGSLGSLPQWEADPICGWVVE